MATSRPALRRFHVLAVCTVLAVGLFGAAEAAAQQEEPTRGETELVDGRVGEWMQDNPVVLGGSTTIEEGREVENVLAIYGHVRIRGTVEGGVLGIRSPVVVESTGRVEADPDLGDEGEGEADEDENEIAIVVQGAPVEVRDGAVVNGDIYGDDVTVAPDAEVAGEVQGFDFDFALGGTFEFVSDVFNVHVFVLGLLFTGGIALSTLALGSLMILLARRGLERAVEVGRRDIGKAVGWGLFVGIVVPVVALLLSFTVIGFPLGWGVLLAYGLFHAVAAAVTIFFVGRLITRGRYGDYVTYLIGWAIYVVPMLIPGPVGFLLLPVYLATPIYGFGMIAVAAWRARTPQAERPATVRSEPEVASVEPSRQ